MERHLLVHCLVRSIKALGKFKSRPRLPKQREQFHLFGKTFRHKHTDVQRLVLRGATAMETGQKDGARKSDMDTDSGSAGKEAIIT